MLYLCFHSKSDGSKRAIFRCSKYSVRLGRFFLSTATIQKRHCKRDVEPESATNEPEKKEVIGTQPGSTGSSSQGLHTTNES
jgi:hypothetical protein